MLSEWHESNIIAGFNPLLNISSIAFRTTMTPECQECSHLRKFPYPVQKLIVDQWKLAAKELTDEETSADEFFDELICLVDWLFWRQYQFSCKHLWHYNIVFDAFQSSDWAIWAEMFEDSGFEMYETSISLKVERHEEIEEIERHMLQMKEVLNAIKKKYYEIAEHTADWTAKKRQSQMQRWIDWLNKLISFIKRHGVEKALRELKDEETAALATAKAAEATGTGGKKRQWGEKKEENDSIWTGRGEAGRSEAAEGNFSRRAKGGK